MEQLISQMSDEDVKTFVKSFDTVITFCEGVLNRKDREIVGSQNAIDVLKKCGKRILYFTRNSQSSRREICENMRKMNYDVKSNEIVCITSLLAKFLKNRLHEKKVYVVGSSGISEELNVVGLENFGNGPDVLSTDLATFVHSFKHDPEVGAVVVGLDEHFSYPKMLRAASYLSSPEVMHVACSSGSSISAGIIACIETCAGKKAFVFDNTPSTINDTLTDGYRIVPERTLIVAPGNSNDIFLARFQRFRDFLSSSSGKTLSTTLAESHRNESTIISARDLAEVAARLKILL